VLDPSLLPPVNVTAGHPATLLANLGLADSLHFAAAG
jgi:hypothetical protein